MEPSGEAGALRKQHIDRKRRLNPTSNTRSKKKRGVKIGNANPSQQQDQVPHCEMMVASRYESIRRYIESEDHSKPVPDEDIEAFFQEMSHEFLEQELISDEANANDQLQQLLASTDRFLESNDEPAMLVSQEDLDKIYQEFKEIIDGKDSGEKQMKEVKE
ncbi:hypothetical protein Scep_025508 [Stephania cephalantha]|uniref:Uncharacterized protein n=1 Tax=Stephania cephalantha TaxID=152367 RepID=A0AAP0EIU1_9MAGN